jgi:ribonucleotide reductase beta subunit family protein with ferritin-like domain
MLLNNFQSWYVKYFKRKANMTAHYLAKATHNNLNLKQIWIEEYPSFIFDIVSS